MASQTSNQLKRKAPTDHNVSSNSRALKKIRPNRYNVNKDARTIATQASFKAFKQGELDVERFVKAREYEIRALEQGLVNSKKVLMKRAFQLVPKELRRRTASHNAKRVPKRLRGRAVREMKDDNTPTVTARRRQLSGHRRLRLGTARRLRALATARKNAKLNAQSDRLLIRPIEAAPAVPRRARVKKAKLSDPPLPKAKFRKRQREKSWLPTHLFHAKRARMTPPKEPLWRFAIPLTPTAKSYRPTHRAAHQRGAIAFDMSYVSTIMLSGRRDSLLGALCILDRDEALNALRTPQMLRWAQGMRTIEFLAYHRDNTRKLIAPITAICCPRSRESTDSDVSPTERTSILIRIHPSAFLEFWEECLRISHVVKPAITVEDLRYEVGSIEVCGPAATEACVMVLQACNVAQDEMLRQLGGLTNTALLPANTIINVEVQDPRLCRHAQRHRWKQQAVSAQDLALWQPPDSDGALFNRTKRRKASSSLSSQRAIDRRRTAAQPGTDPSTLDTDPHIPVLMHTSTSWPNKLNKWTLLLPWKCVLPVWYALVYAPLSSGLQLRLGGLVEARDLSLEHGNPWFPADYPACRAGRQWEIMARRRLQAEWNKRPKSKRVNWKTLDIGEGQKGEIGDGWACDWSRLCNNHNGSTTDQHNGTVNTDGAGTQGERVASATCTSESQLYDLQHVSLARFEYLTQRTGALSTNGACLLQVRIEQIARGVPQPCARIYCLPDAADDHRRWLMQDPKYAGKRAVVAKGLNKISRDAPGHLLQRELARSLLAVPQAGQSDYPRCPDESHLIGFVTSGNYDLGAGRGTAVGSILISALSPASLLARNEKRQQLCIVRNSGQTLGRLAKWESL